MIGVGTASLSRITVLESCAGRQPPFMMPPGAVRQIFVDNFAIVCINTHYEKSENYLGPSEGWVV